MTQVLVKLSAPAIVAEAPMKPGDALTAIFNIKNEDIKRFLEALNKRGLVSPRISVFSVVFLIRC